MKGAAAEDELTDAEKSFSVLGAEIKEEHSFILPDRRIVSVIFLYLIKLKTHRGNIRENQVFRIRSPIQ